MKNKEKINRNQFQKEKERFQILPITSLLGIHQDKELEMLDTVRPDFKINYEGKQVGIEVTEVRPHQKRNDKNEIIDVSAINNALEKVIRSRLKLNDIKGFRVDAIPQDAIYYSRLDTKNPKLIEEIDNLLKDRIVSHQFFKSIEIGQLRGPDGTEYFIDNNEIGIHIYWGGGFLELIPPSSIIEVIRKKEELYTAYNKENNYCFDELWLFIVLSHEEHGFTFKGFELPYEFSSVYNRIYVGQHIPPFANCIYQK